MGKQKFLLENIQHWRNEALIDDRQRRRLNEDVKSRYVEYHFNASIIFSVIGGILIGLGIILLLAFNWEYIGKYPKLFFIFAAILGFHIAGYKVSLKAKSLWVPEMLRIIGTMCFGAGIALVAQIYHIDEHAPNGILLFVVGATCASFLYRSIPQGVLGIIGLILWFLFSRIELYPFFRSAESFQEILNLFWYTPLFAVIVFGSLSCYLRSFLLTILTTLAFCSLWFMSIGLSDTYFFQYFFMLIIFLYVLSFTFDFKPDLRRYVLFFRILGHVLFIPCFFLLTIWEVVKNINSLKGTAQGELYTPLFVMILLFLAVCIFLIGKYLYLKRDVASDVRDCIETIGTPLVLTLLLMPIFFMEKGSTRLEPGQFYILCFFANIAFVYLSIKRIFYGCKNHMSLMTILGVLMFCAWIIVRFLGMFDAPLITRGFAFLIIGGIMIAVAVLYQKMKKKEERI